jgi:predicted permease
MPANERALSIAYNTVDEHYFSTMQIPFVSGRAFDQNDTTSSRLVAIVNEAMARQYWPKRSAIGGRVKVGGQTLEVIGIAKDIKYRDIAEARRPFLYLPFSQQYRSRMTLHVETSGDPASMAAPVLAEIRRLDSGQPVQEVQTLQHFFEEGALFGNRLIMQLVTVIGLLGLLLAIAGQYGVVSYSVSRQTREIGIRMAVGAGAGDVGRMVLRQGMLLTLAGLLIGGGLAALASSAVATLLVGVSALDPVVYVLIGLLLCAVSLLACYVPARRASRIDPLQALRQE